MASSDLVGNLGQRRIIRTGVLKPVLRHRDRMSVAAPFANQACSGLEGEAWRCANSTRGSQGFCNRLQLATRRLAEPAVLHFLKPVSESKDKEIATDPR